MKLRISHISAAVGVPADMGQNSMAAYFRPQDLPPIVGNAREFPEWQALQLALSIVARRHGADPATIQRFITPELARRVMARSVAYIVFKPDDCNDESFMRVFSTQAEMLAFVAEEVDVSVITAARIRDKINRAMLNRMRNGERRGGWAARAAANGAG